MWFFVWQNTGTESCLPHSVLEDVIAELKTYLLYCFKSVLILVLLLSQLKILLVRGKNLIIFIVNVEAVTELSSQSQQLCKYLNYKLPGKTQVCKVCAKALIGLGFASNLWMYLENCRTSMGKNCKCNGFQKETLYGHSLMLFFHHCDGAWKCSWLCTLHLFFLYTRVCTQTNTLLNLITIKIFDASMPRL